MVASTGAYSTIPLFPLFHSSTLPWLVISHISATRKPNLRKPSAPSLLLPEDPASLLHLVLPISSSAGYLGYLGVNQLVGSPSFALFPVRWAFLTPSSTRGPPRRPGLGNGPSSIGGGRRPKISPRGHRPPHPATQPGPPEHPCKLTPGTPP